MIQIGMKKIGFWVGAFVLELLLGMIAYRYATYHPTDSVYSSPTPTTIPTPIVIHFNPYVVAQAVNAERTKHGMLALVWNGTLCGLADERLLDIHSDFSHDKWLSELQQQSYFSPMQRFGENLAEGQNSVTDLMSEWIASPEHEQNILDRTFFSTCVTTDTVGYTTFTVQEFSGLRG